MSRRSVFPAEERGEGFDAHAQAGGRGDLLAVHGVEQGRLAGQCGHPPPESFSVRERENLEPKPNFEVDMQYAFQVVAILCVAVA